MVGSPIQPSLSSEKGKKEESFHKVFMGTFSCCYCLPIFRHRVFKFFTKPLSVLSISTKYVQRPFVCDPLGPNIFLVNNSIDPIIYIVNLINHFYQHIY